jgi:hypothetical protein
MASAPGSVSMTEDGDCGSGEDSEERADRIVSDRDVDGPQVARLVDAGYLVTISDCVDTGPAPAPGNADPTPLNITSVTVYRPGRLYVCVGDWPEPVVPSPNSQRYVITGCALTVPSAEKLTGRPADRCFGPKVKPAVIPL